jgi:actin-related protein
MPQFPEPVDIVCSGGSSMIGGFIEVFKEELDKMTFPIPVNQVRLAAEPLYATAKGCLLAGLSELE